MPVIDNHRLQQAFEWLGETRKSIHQALQRSSKIYRLEFGLIEVFDFIQRLWVITSFKHLARFKSSNCANSLKTSLYHGRYPTVLTRTRCSCIRWMRHLSYFSFRNIPMMISISKMSRTKVCLLVILPRQPAGNCNYELLVILPIFLRLCLKLHTSRIPYSYKFSFTQTSITVS